MYKVTIGTGWTNVTLPSGAVVSAGGTAVLTNDEFAQLPPSAFQTLSGQTAPMISAYTQGVSFAPQDPASRYQLLAASGSFTVPSAVTQVRVRMIGAGGGGGGAGSATAGTGTLQHGGPGGGAGQVLEFMLAVTPGDVWTVTCNSGGGGGSASAIGGAGGAGSLGGTTLLAKSGVTYTALGGGPGAGSAANSTATPSAGAYGANQSIGSQMPGAGGRDATLAIIAGPDGVWGGNAGGNATATNGGGAGGASTRMGNGAPVIGGNGASATVVGVDGVTATQPGCGGGGGGGGSGSGSGGAGGAGGAGAKGQIEFWW